MLPHLRFDQYNERSSRTGACLWLEWRGIISSTAETLTAVSKHRVHLACVTNARGGPYDTSMYLILPSRSRTWIQAAIGI
jgi:hypothetical protein